MNDRSVVVGLDLGTSSVKAAAVDAQGRVLARARREYPTSRSGAGVAEQDPADWWRATGAVLAELATLAPTRDWIGLGLSAMLPTLVALDDQHEPVTAAITWQDARGEAAGERLRSRIGADELYRRTGQWVDGRYLLPMAAALSERDPAAGARVRVVAGAKDYLHRQLTGELLTDPSTAAGYGCYDLAAGRWDGTIGNVWTLPPVMPSSTITPLSSDVATHLGLPARLPVVLGAADSVLAAKAVGADRAGDVAYLCGTSTVVLACRDEITLDPEHRYLLTPTADGSYAAELDLLATGTAMSWLAGLFGLAGGASELAELAAQPAEPGQPTFLPYLAPGEQGALWDADLSGAVLGLNVRHGRQDLARALLTGIVLESVRCLRVLGGESDVLAGGRAMAGRFAQDLADASGRRVRFDPTETAHSAVGAALLAAATVGMGGFGSHGPAQIRTPDPRRRESWDELFAIHDAARIASGHGPGRGRR
ncbi:MAG: xylulokinase [Jatrophihabitantaceae bacterium]